MARKALLFLSIFLLVLSTTAFAKEEGADDKRRDDKGGEPKKENVVPKDEKAPVQAATPAQPNGDAAAKPQGQDGNVKCQPLCQELCKGHRRKRPCVKACTACCAKSKCVPLGEKKCSNWDSVVLGGELTVKCPAAK